MKPFQFIGLIACVAVFVGCESTETTAGGGNQEAKRLAALRQQRHQEQPDEAAENLWIAQENVMNRDGNPARRY